MSTQDTLDFVRFGEVLHYAHAGAYSVFVYDWLLCLGDEIDFILTPAPAIAKLAYLYCRYCLLLTYPITLYIQGLPHSHSICEHVFRVPMLLALPNLAGVVSIITLRLYAFTGGKKSLVVFIILCYIAIATYHTWVVFDKAILNPDGQGCDPVEAGNTNNLGSIFLGAMILDTFITIAFITHLLRVMKLKYTQMSVFTRAFLREGAAYFLAISCVNLLNVAFNLQHAAPMADVNVPYSLVLPSLLACRLVINLRNLIPEHKSYGSVSSDSRRPWAYPSTDTENGTRISGYVVSPLSAGEGTFLKAMESPPALADFPRNSPFPQSYQDPLGRDNSNFQLSEE
ncbi:hypothetical protein EXIGLDRAFT_833988 [Exidia glandulosa HHB12029]|uniref:DUF6533 domain-containing protein n=1 Tax=Exidia glandulosa HHB12029 TaxID=1314781 RepID=A0A165K897_EXIGL|nr:hypothetical protein EXIGLDRAFT_833988 [Exidia glandulosa HHB12029]